jgi:hypothetical protein
MATTETVDQTEEATSTTTPQSQDLIDDGSETTEDPNISTGEPDTTRGPILIVTTPETSTTTTSARSASLQSVWSAVTFATLVFCFYT